MSTQWATLVAWDSVEGTVLMLSHEHFRSDLLPMRVSTDDEDRVKGLDRYPGSRLRHAVANEGGIEIDVAAHNRNGITSDECSRTRLIWMAFAWSLLSGCMQPKDHVRPALDDTDDQQLLQQAEKLQYLENRVVQLSNEKNHLRSLLES